jgi:hypothetical protein
MKAYSITLAAALLLSLPAFADDDAARTRQSTTIHKEDANVMHKRSEQGERNANDPSSPHRALGRERAEERHEMQEHREMRGTGGTGGEEEHRTIRRESKRSVDKDDNMKHRMETERHEKTTTER